MNKKNTVRPLKILCSLFFLCLSIVLPMLAYGMFNAEFLVFLKESSNLWLYFNLILITSIITCWQLNFHDYVAKHFYNYIVMKETVSEWTVWLSLLSVMATKFMLLMFSYRISAMIAIYYKFSSPQAIQDITDFFGFFSIFLLLANAFIDLCKMYSNDYHI